MKMLLLTIACFTLSTTNFAQPEARKFTPSIKVGAGFWTDELSVLNAELGIQGEYKAARLFSIYGNISYNRMFEVSEISYGINHLTFLAGPRLYVSKSFFTGIGAGYLLFFTGGISEGSFAFNPHIGIDRPKTQWTINYTATTKEQINGYISIGAAFKLGAKRSANQ
ncbi:MAG: hypothetical protein ACRC2O_10555 [Chitinophagaceae bacterium]